MTDREATLAEFEDYLRTTNNRHGRPYQDKTIEAYVLPAKGIEGDFTAADTALLNKYFREYYQEHGQGGTHTCQRNLIQLYNFLQHWTRCREALPPDGSLRSSQIARWVAMLLRRISGCARSSPSSLRSFTATLSTVGAERMYVGVRWRIVTWAAVRAIAGASVTAVAPLPMMTTR